MHASLNYIVNKLYFYNVVTFILELWLASYTAMKYEGIASNV